MFVVRDTRGRVLFRLEKDDAQPREAETGEVIAQRAGKESELRELALFAGMRMADLTLDLTPGDVVSPTTTRAEFSIPGGWREFIADLVSPVTYIEKDRGTYFTENVADALQIVEAHQSMIGNPAEVNPRYASTSFVTQPYAIAARVPAPTMGSADFDLRKRTVRFLVDQLRRARELRVAQQLTTAANFAAANQIAAGTAWSGANPTQVANVFAALQASYLPADTIVLPENVAPYYAYTAAGSTGLQVRDLVQAGIEMPHACMARAKMGTGGSPAYIWMPSGHGGVPVVRTVVHNEAWRAWREARSAAKRNDLGPTYDLEPVWAPNDRLTDIGTSHTLRWLGEGAIDGVRAGGVLVREFKEEPNLGGAGGVHWIVVAMNDIEIMPSNLVGALITGAL